MSHKIKLLEGKHWPPLLKEINQLPDKLYFAGQIPDWKRKILCVVGARKCTSYGKEVAETLIEGLKNYPVTIVSGLAFGIDSISHRAAIKNKLPTIAVPGSGLLPSVLHPQSHRKLAEEITESGGTLMNEFVPDFKATHWSFPQRNRIMAGMSHATLIIEAEKKSGTLITARLAIEYNRDVLTVPGNIFNTTSEGPHMLLRLGAVPVRKSEDILEVLNLTVDESLSAEASQDEKKYFDCSEKEMKIIDMLKEPLERDEILRRALMLHSLQVGETQTLLSLLELKGLVKESLGQIRLS
jgi:DNA processing protein